MDLTTLVIGLVLAQAIYDLIKFSSRLISQKILFNRMIKNMQKEVDDLVIAKNQLQAYPTVSKDSEGWEEVPVEVIAAKKPVTH